MHPMLQELRDVSPWQRELALGRGDLASIKLLTGQHESMRRYPMLLRRWPNIKATLRQRLIFTG